VLQVLGGPFFPAWREIYHGLPRLIEQTRWLDELPAELRARGFTDIDRENLTLYGSAIITARRPT
jgi:demethylmenaquinone methyltransferase/2-methoxy-6-polyprenyl-1,4-benzoquinol methylase